MTLLVKLSAAGYYCVVVPALAAQILLLVFAVKRKKEWLFLASFLTGILSIGYVYLTAISNGRQYHSLVAMWEIVFDAALPTIYWLVCQISITIRLAIKDKMPTRLPIGLFWWLSLIIYLVLLILAILS